MLGHYLMELLFIVHIKSNKETFQKEMYLVQVQSLTKKL